MKEEVEDFSQKHFLNLSNRLITIEEMESIVNSLFNSQNKKRILYSNGNGSNLILPKFKVNNIEHYRRALSHKSFIIEQNLLIDKGILPLYQNLNNENFDIIEKIKEFDSNFDYKIFKEWKETGNSTIDYITRQSYERYEFLGDSILKTIQGEYIFHRYPGRSGKATEFDQAKKISENNEEFMTVLRTKIEKTEQLAKFVKYLGLEKYILISSHIENLNYPGQGRNNTSLQEDIFEAIIGAIIQDKQNDSFEERGKRFSYAYYFVVGVMEETINFSELVLRNDNFKDSLLKYISQEKWDIINSQGKKSPFEEILTTGPSNNRKFIIGVFIQLKYIKNKDKVKLYSNNMEKILNNEGKRNLHSLLSQKNKQKVNDDIYFLVGMGTDNSKKASEQKASNKALYNLGIPLNY